MRIQHNIMAMSAYRNYTNNVSAMKKNLEKLSSGYKINRAGDDAAGLAISEKMRAQITGLETAQKNAKDGISLVQTAEGALTEVHDMLNRMVELATMSANGTYDNDVDRAQLQKEMDQLRSEINRIADSSNFNGIKLLDGSLDGGTKIGAAENITVTAVADGDQDAKAGQAPVYSFDLKDFNGMNAGTMASFTMTIGGEAITIGATLTYGTALGKDFDAEDIASKIATGCSGKLVIDGMTYTVKADGTKVTLTAVSVPTTTASYSTPIAVTVSMVGNASNNNSFDLGVHVDTAPQVAQLPKVAQGKFTLEASHIKDGAQITIGKDTYTFKVGKDSTVGGSNVIDLSGFEDGDANLVRAAAHALSKQSNSMFDITTQTVADSATSATITLTEKKGTVDYEKDWNLKGGAGAADGIWNKNAAGEDIGVVQIGQPTAGTGTSLKLQIGDTADEFNQLKVNIGDIHTKALNIASISIADQTSAATAIDSIKDAINQVSDIRGTLGATQNRLDHTINNLSVMTENIQDAESTIRDTDVAEEMMAYTKNNILIQSAQAMLAQANQVPQGVLQLLQ